MNTSTMVLQAADCTDLWVWILKQACFQNENFLSKYDKAGETCIDCFMSAWINGTKMGWSEPTSNFARAAEKILKSSQSIAMLRSKIDLQRQQEALPVSKQQQPTTQSRQCPADIFLVSRVWRAFDLLCRAAALGSVDLIAPGSDNDFQILAFLAKMSSCNSLFARLAVALFPEQLRQKDADELLPIHIWAQGSSAKKQEDDDAGLLSPMVRSCPEATLVALPNGQLPIHAALSNEKTLRDVQELWKSSPNMLGYADPQTLFYPFAHAAHSSRTELRGILRGLQRRGPAVSLYDWLDATRDTESAEQEASCYLLGCVYDMLRTNPQALQDSLVSGDDADLV
uniref:Uncharacterized protein n=1 Tax=Entomoneis paludosa TaxID=265537 RepID=A0A7S2V9N6_9STRA